MNMQEIGAYVGLAVGVFTVYDRVFANRLIHSLSKSIRGKYGTDLWIRNFGKIDAVVSAVFVYPRIYNVAENDSVNGFVRADIGEKFFYVLRSEEDVRLPIVRKGGDTQEAVTSRWFLIIVSWRHANSMWLPHFPLFILSSVRSIRAIEGASA